MRSSKLLFCGVFILLMSFCFSFEITDCNTILTTPGTYYLQNDLNFDANYCTVPFRGQDWNVCILSLDLNNVEIDFNGHKIFHSGSPMDFNNIGVLFTGSGPYISDINIVRGTATGGVLDLVDFNTGAANVIISDANIASLIVGVTSCGLEISTVDNGLDENGDQIYGKFYLANDLNVDAVDLTDENACISLNSDYLWLVGERKAIFGSNTKNRIGIADGKTSLYNNIIASLDFNNLYTAISLSKESQGYYIIDNRFSDINSIVIKNYNNVMTNDNLVNGREILWFNKYYYDINLPNPHGGRVYYSDINCPPSFDYNNVAAFVFYGCNYASPLDVNGLAAKDNLITGAGNLAPFTFVDSNNIIVHDYNISLLPMSAIDAINEYSIYAPQTSHSYLNPPCRRYFKFISGTPSITIYNIYGYYDNNQIFSETTPEVNIKYRDINLEGAVYFASSPYVGHLIKNTTINGVGLWSFNSAYADYNCPTDLNSDYANAGFYQFLNCSNPIDFNGLVLNPDFSTRLFYSPKYDFGIIHFGSNSLNITNLNEQFSKDGIYAGGPISIRDSNISSSGTDPNYVLVYSCDSDLNISDSNITSLVSYQKPIQIDANSVVDINNITASAKDSPVISVGTAGYKSCISGNIANSSLTVRGPQESPLLDSYALDINNASNCAGVLDVNRNNISGATRFVNYVGEFLDNNYCDGSTNYADFCGSIDANIHNNNFDAVRLLDTNGEIDFYNNIVTANRSNISSIIIKDSNVVLSLYNNNISNLYDCDACHNITFARDTNGIYLIYNNIFSVKKDANYFSISSGSKDINLDLNTNLDCTGSENQVKGSCIGGNFWTSGALTGQSDICEDRQPTYGICDKKYAPSGLAGLGFYDYHPLAEMMFANPGVSPTNVEYTDGIDTIDFNLSTSFYDMYYDTDLNDYIKDNKELDVNLKIYYTTVSDWPKFDYKLRKLIKITNNDSVQKNSFTLDLNLDDYQGLVINPSQITFSDEVDHYAILNTDTNSLRVEIALADFLASGADKNIYVYYDYKWYDNEEKVNTTSPTFYSWRSGSLYKNFKGDFYSVEPANSTFSFAAGTNTEGDSTKIQIYLFNETSTGRTASTAIVDADGNAIVYGGIYNPNDGNFLVYGKLDANAAAYLLDGDDLNTIINTLDFNYLGAINEGVIGSDGNYYLIGSSDSNDNYAPIYKLSADLETIYKHNFLQDIVAAKDIIESDGNLLVMAITNLENTRIYDLNTDLFGLSYDITHVSMAEMEEDEDGNIICVGKYNDENYMVLHKYDRNTLTLIPDSNKVYYDYTINNTDFIDLEIYDGNLFYNGSERGYNYILRFSNRGTETSDYSWILYLDSNLDIVARWYYPNIVFTKESHISNNKLYIGSEGGLYANVYTNELNREDVNTTNKYEEPTLLTNGTIEDYCETTHLNEQTGDKCTYDNNFSNYAKDTNYIMMLYGEARDASSVFRKNMNYFFFSIPTQASGGGSSGGGGAGGGSSGGGSGGGESPPEEENENASDVIPEENEPEENISSEEPTIPEENVSLDNFDIDYIPEINLGEGQHIHITDKEGLCIVGTKVKIIAPDGTTKEYVLDENCELQFIPEEEGDYTMEITLPDGAKIIKQFKVKPKGKVQIFGYTENLITYFIVGSLMIFLIGFVVYRYFFPKRVRDLRDV